MIRTLRTISLMVALAAGQAHASSIMVLEAREEALSPSIVAIEPITGEPTGTEETTAAVEEESRPSDTLVIRGGIFGTPFPLAGPAESRNDPAIGENEAAADDPGLLPGHVSRPE